MSFKKAPPEQESSKSNILQKIIEGNFFGGNVTIGRIIQIAINIAFPFQSQHSRFAQFVALLGYITFILVGFYRLEDHGFADLYTQCLLIIGTVLLSLTCSYYAWFWVPHRAKVIAKKRQRIRRFSMFSIVVIPLLIYTGFNALSYIASETPIIVVAKFKGEEVKGYYKDQYQVRDEIREKVESSTNTEEERAKVLSLDNPIEGFDVAEKEGKQKNAAIVIWGRYGECLKPGCRSDLTIKSRFQMLEKLRYLPVLKDKQEREKKVKDRLDQRELVHTLALGNLNPVLESLASEMSYLSLFSLGLIHYTHERWERAISRFTDALEKVKEVKELKSSLEPSQISHLIENTRSMANTNSDRSANKKAIEGYTRAEQLISTDLLTPDNGKNDRSQHHDLILANYTPISHLKFNSNEAYDNPKSNYISQDNNSLPTDANDSAFIKAYRAKNFNNRGVAYARQGNNNQVIADYAQAIQLDPNLVEAYSNQGAAYAEADKHELAIESINQAIRLNPINPLAYNNRGNAYAYQGKYQEAVDDYDQAIKLKSDFAEAYYNRGRIYLLLKSYQEAIESFQKATGLKPNFSLKPDFSEIYLPEVYYYLGVAYYNQQNCSQAIESFDKAIDREPNVIASYEYRGECLLARSDDKAFGDYDQIIRLDPNDSGAYNNRGLVSLNRGDFDKALADFNKAIKLDPDNSRIFINLGAAYLNKKDYTQAIINFDEAIRLDAKTAIAYNDRGTAYLNKKEYEQASSDFNKAIQLDPDNDKFYFNRGFLFLSRNSYKEAIKDFDTAIKLNENYDYVYFYRGIAYRADGDKSNAVDDFEKVISMTSDSSLQKKAEQQLEELDPDRRAANQEHPPGQGTNNPFYIPGNGTSGRGGSSITPNSPRQDQENPPSQRNSSNIPGVRSRSRK
ncbi:tetratricopeptide repeat protein [Phormidesmis priestleyi]